MSEDRRVLRRNQTVQEILDVATEVMAEEGVGALSLAEVARRMGMRPPSLYEYFPSRMAVYDALFERGAARLLDVIESHVRDLADEPIEAIRAGQQAWFSWSMTNQVITQLLFWRPVPGFEPSPPAFALAVRQLDILRTALQAAVAAGRLAPEAATDEGVALFTSLISGILTQQMANEPDLAGADGRFVRLAPKALEMFFRYYSPEEETAHDRLTDHRSRSARG